MKTATILLILILTLTLGFGFLHTLQMSEHSHGSHCPFMSNDSVICTMSPILHISAWQEMFRATTNYPLLFIIFLINLQLFFAYFIFYKPPAKKLKETIVEQILARVPTILQILFSNGILNPKAP